MWVIGKSKAQDAKAIMVNGPQFGWYAPAYTYGIGLHGAGYDVTGNTPFAYPGLVFGHNGVISWGSTAGFGDDVDIFAERLSAEKPGYYLHNGKWVKMLSREETITVKMVRQRPLLSGVRCMATFSKLTRRHKRLTLNPAHGMVKRWRLCWPGLIR